MTEKYDTRNIKILVIDDEKDITYFLSEFLLELGYQVKTENDPGKAEETFLGEVFDVVFVNNTPELERVAR